MKAVKGKASSLDEVKSLCQELHKGSGRVEYPDDFKSKVCDLVKSGTPVSLIMKATGIAGSTIYKWHKHSCSSAQIENPVRVLEVEHFSSKIEPPLNHSKVLLSLRAGDFEISVYSPGG